MNKEFVINVSLDEKSGFETAQKQDITDNVFDSITEAVEEGIKETLSLDNEDFVNSILQNYHQTLPENFKSLKDIGLKIEVKKK